MKLTNDAESAELDFLNSAIRNPQSAFLCSLGCA